jgi:hypothetical protein
VELVLRAGYRASDTEQLTPGLRRKLANPIRVTAPADKRRVRLPWTCSSDYLVFFFFSCLASFFSFIVFSGFFLSLFFESKPLLMLLSAVCWCYGRLC